MVSSQKHTIVWLFLALAIIGVAYSFFEVRSYQQAKTDENIQWIVQKSIDDAKERFQQVVFNFTNGSTLFAERIKSGIEQDLSSEELFQAYSTNHAFWGFAVIEKNEYWLWDGFIPSIPLEEITATTFFFVSVRNDNNVTYLYAIIPFSVEKKNTTTPYYVLTAHKLAQENILPLGKELERAPNYFVDERNGVPINVSFSKVIPENTTFYSFLSTVSTDSVGILYHNSNEAKSISEFNDYKVTLIRTVFLFLLLFILGLLSFFFSKSFDGIAQFLIQLFTWITLWLIAKSILPLLGFLGLDSSQINYVCTTLLALLIAISVSVFFKKRTFSPNKKNPSLFTPGILIGIGFGLVSFFFFEETSHQIVIGSIGVMDSGLLPQFKTFLFYVISSLFLVSFNVVFTSIMGFFFTVLRDHLWRGVSAILIGYFLFVLLEILVFDGFGSSVRLLVSSIANFAVLLFFSMALIKKESFFQANSNLRLLLLLGFWVSVFLYIPFLHGNSERQHQIMQHSISQFTIARANETEDITKELVYLVSNEITKNDLKEYNEIAFDEMVESFVQNDWLKYTISVQYISREGALLADYTTSLSPPQWSTAFRIQELEFPFEDERIQRRNLRPILRSRPINTTNSEYSSFKRGWLPVYENPTSDLWVGWVLCSVFKELPQFERPLRAVVSSTDAEINEAITVTEYQDGKAIQTEIFGIPLPVYNPTILPESIEIELQNAEKFFLSTAPDGKKIKELYVNYGNRIIRAASKQLDFSGYMFAFLRLLFLLIGTGMVLLTVSSLFKKKYFFGEEPRFKDRIIDRFIVTSLLCLFTLVGVTYFVLDAQNDRTVQDRLTSRLQNLTDNLETEWADSFLNPTELQKITSFLDVDASLYINGSLANTTTSQIFTQNILPKSAPWSIYDALSANRITQGFNTITLDGKEMLIGYRTWTDQDNQIVGIAAIPTFLKAPVYYDRLLSTTGYLVAFFSVVFGLLMIGIGIISSQLTQPLERLKVGLKEITEGNLETKLPVQGTDEISTLTRAYNLMVKRLKSARRELALKEREVAWKQMAQQVAHEIKNPLTPMKLNLQHLERQLLLGRDNEQELNPKISGITSSIIEQIDSLDKIASDFSKFAKPSHQERIPLDLNTVARSVSEFYQNDGRFEFHTDFAKIKIPILGSEEELRRALVNLIKNGIEAINENGIISLQTIFDPKGKYAILLIKDNGEGISVEDQQHIFVPNFSTKSSGTGLGLAITKKIIEEHEGGISFQSMVSNGTSFTIRIPLLRQ